MLKEKCLKLILGVILFVFIFGDFFLFNLLGEVKKENIRLNKEINLLKKLESLVSNKPSLFYEVPEDWLTYQNEKYGFEIKYPREISAGQVEIKTQEPTEGKIIGGVKEKEIITFDYYKEGKATLDNFVYNFSILIFEGDLTPEFLEHYLSEYAFSSIEEGDINYWGEEIKKINLKEKFIRKIAYLNDQTFALEIYHPIRSPTVFGALQKVYFIPYPEKNLIFEFSSVYGDRGEIKAMTLFEKIVSTFRKKN